MILSDVNDPIYCFNDTECTYKGKCYNETLSVCEFEWLKAVFKAGTPAQTAPAQAAPTTAHRSPFRRVAPKAESKEGDSTPYSAITKDAKNVKVSGKIESITEMELNTKKGPVDVVKVILSNGREKLRITFWDPSKVPDIQEGDEVEFSGLMGADPYKGDAQANGGDYVKVVVK